MVEPEGVGPVVVEPEGVGPAVVEPERVVMSTKSSTKRNLLHLHCTL